MITISLISHCISLKMLITPILRSRVCYSNSFSLDISSSAHWIRSHFYRDACLQMVGESSGVNTFPFQPAQGYCGGMVSYGARAGAGEVREGPSDRFFSVQMNPRPSWSWEPERILLCHCRPNPHSDIICCRHRTL